MSLSPVPLTSTWAALEDTWAGLDSRWHRGTNVQIDLTDVSDDSVSVSVSRGKSRDLARISAGQLQASFRNDNRQFDPTTPGPRRDLVIPRKPIRVIVDGFQVFGGFVDDWNFNYEPGGISTASLDASDGFSLLARQGNALGTAVEESSGDRVERVLDQATVNWPTADRDIATGQTTLEAGVLEGNALEYLLKVSDSESSLLFVDAQGVLNFQARLVQPVTDAIQFTDRGDGIPYQGIAISYGTEDLVNRAVITSSAGTAIREDTDSQNTYGITEQTLDTLLLSTAQLEGLGDYLVFRYKEPEFRIESVTVNVRALSDSQVNDVLGLDLGDQADVIFRPSNQGDTIALRNRVIGISHDVSIESHFVTITFEALPFTFFVLDDAVFGKLDNTDGVLGF
jgi:hypothetical protein